MRSAPTISSSSAWRRTITSRSTNVYPSQSINNTINPGWAWEPSWVTFILPEMEQQPAYNAINFNLPMLEIGFVSPNPIGGMANSTAGLMSIASLLCPSESIIAPGELLRRLGPVQLRR